MVGERVRVSVGLEFELGLMLGEPWPKNHPRFEMFLKKMFPKNAPLIPAKVEVSIKSENLFIFLISIQTPVYTPGMQIKTE